MVLVPRAARVLLAESGSQTSVDELKQKPSITAPEDLTDFNKGNFKKSSRAFILAVNYHIITVIFKDFGKIAN